MKVGLIAAISENNVIGLNGKIPWHIPEDLKRFRKLTIGHPVIMGRKTCESLGKPLEKRLNIVISSQKNHVGSGFYFFDSLKSSLKYIEENEFIDIDKEKVYIIGGSEIYNQGIAICDFMDITRVKGNYEGDAFFPKVNWSEWEEKSREDFENYSFIHYERK